MPSAKPLVIAHRGASLEAPENTMAAFRLALAQGADGLELDVHLSRDGRLVVIHDDLLDRTTNGSGAVSSKTVAELKRIDAGSWFNGRYAGQRIPTLEEVFDATPRHILINVEIKGGRGRGVERALVALLRRKRRVGNVIVSDFDYRSLARISRLDPEVKLGLLYEWPIGHMWKLLQTGGINAYSLHPNYRYVDAQQVTRAVARGKAVFPWTVDEEDDMRMMIDFGVTGIITNEPAKLRHLLAER